MILRRGGLAVIVCSVTFKLRYTFPIILINYIYSVGAYGDRMSELAVSYNSVKHNIPIKKLVI